MTTQTAKKPDFNDLKNMDVKDLKTLFKREPKEPAREPFVPTLPSVDLLPAQIQDDVKLRRLRWKMGVACLGVVGAVAAGWVVQEGLILSAQHNLDQQQTQQTTLNAQMTTLAPVANFYKSVTNAQTTVQTTMNDEVLTSVVFAHLTASLPHGVTLQQANVAVMTGTGAAASNATVSATSTGSGSTGCPVTTPFEPQAPSGCVSIQGHTTSRALVAQWMNALSKDPMFNNVFVPTSTFDPKTGSLTFSGSIGLTSKIYSHRYASPAFLKSSN